jgi:protease I
MANPSTKKALMIIASANFRDEEFEKPRTILASRGIAITTASTKTGEAKGALGARVNVDTLVSGVKASDYDAVIFVGGGGSSEYFNLPAAHRLARDAVSQGKILGAICIAPSTLANAGVLNGKKATCFGSESGNLKSKGANYTGNPVEQDGKIITAIGPEAASKFGEAIAAALGV